MYNLEISFLNRASLAQNFMAKLILMSKRWVGGYDGSNFYI